MRATEIIRNLLDIIDGVEAANPPPVQQVTIAINSEPTEPEVVDQPEKASDELARFKQITDLMHNTAQTYANEPSEQISSLESVTSDAGGGVNGPKDPADIKSNSISMYPAAQWKGN